MGPVEIIEVAAKGVAEFAKKHALLATATAAVVGSGVVYYNNYNEADRANGGGVVKQDVAVNDKNGDLRMKMRGLGKEAAAAKAVDPAKPDTKSDNGDVLKKLQDAAKDAGIQAETANAAEQTSTQPELPPEKPYIPETAADASYNDTNSNLLDGNGSEAFKTARFASSGGGSGSNAGKASARSGSKSATKSVSGTKSVAASAATAGSGVKSAATTSETASAGKAEIAKTGGEKGGDKGGETGNNQGNASKPETGKEISSDNNASGDKTETANTSNSGGDTVQETRNVAPANVENTIVTGASVGPSSLGTPSPENWNVFKRNSNETLEQKKQEEARRLWKEKRDGLRQEYLQKLRNAFEKEADCDADDVVSSFTRQEVGITSNDVMGLAAESTMRVKEITLDVDEKETPSGLINFLAFLGNKNIYDKFNHNVSFLLRNGSGFFKGVTTIPGVVLEAQSTAMIITFPKATSTAHDKKKPDTKEPVVDAGKKAESGLKAPVGGATTTSGGATLTFTTTPVVGSHPSG